MNSLLPKKRLKTLEKLLRISPTDMAKLFGCSVSSYYRYRNGTSSPDLETISKLFEFNDSINPEWLLTGKGRVFLTDEHIENPASDWESETIRLYSLPLYHMKSNEINSEGNFKKIKWDNPPDYFTVCSMFIKNMIGINHKRLFAITVDCNAMAPVIQPGSLVIADKQQKDIVNDGIYVVAFDDVIRLKLIQKYPGNRLQLSSINDHFKPLVIKADSKQEIEILGRIVWVGTTL